MLFRALLPSLPSHRSPADDRFPPRAAPSRDGRGDGVRPTSPGLLDAARAQVRMGLSRSPPLHHARRGKHHIAAARTSARRRASSRRPAPPHRRGGSFGGRTPAAAGPTGGRTSETPGCTLRGGYSSDGPCRAAHVPRVRCFGVRGHLLLDWWSGEDIVLDSYLYERASIQTRLGRVWLL